MNNTPALQSIIAEMREEAHERMQEDRSVGIFADPQTADLLTEWADRLEAATAQPAEGVMVGEVVSRSYGTGIDWTFGFPVLGTKLYAAAPSQPEVQE